MEDQRICIEFCVKNGLKGAEIFWMLQRAYGDAVMSRRQVFEWYKRFKEGREETADNERSGRPSTSTTPEKVDKVLELVREDRRITVREVAEEAGISFGSTQSIMKGILGKARKAPCKVKVMLTVFFDYQGIVHHEFQQQGSTITADSYLGVLRRLREAIRQKRPELWRSKSWILHHDNAPAHTALKISKFLQDHSTSVFPQLPPPPPPYSPDLAPCDFFLFGKLKVESKKAMKVIPKTDYQRCFADWKKRWLKCIATNGDYFEGDNLNLHRKKWVAAFKLGRISTEGELRPGRPVESVTQENIDKIHDLVMLDRRMTVLRTEETLGIPKTTVDRIMKEHLVLRKLSASWVPKLLTPDQKAVRRKLSSDNLALFEANSEEFFNRFVTMNETWAHYFTPESKQQSMQWRPSGSPPPKKDKTVPSAGKVMVSVFWDSEGVLLLDFLNKDKTIAGNYYANLVKQLREAIK
ncbi:hypothetical protein LAZ67_3004693 [Cordylochernes scorpioides]|uniref:Mos1 transposase HTH domain-containing protein n=1 Tax=Cordylochernes scorpioides TaxID=51811 RepID=A0ABY6KA22_9ARAC|nr:hypothetical protein LAZ67_3004693 [Cordylochernes scorpioides]